MRITLVNFSIVPHINLELALMVSSLKQAGYGVHLVDLAPLYTASAAERESFLLRELVRASPDVISFFRGYGYGLEQETPSSVLLERIRPLVGDIPLLIEGMHHHPRYSPAGSEHLGKGIWKLTGELSDAAVFFLRSLERGHLPATREVFAVPRDINSLPFPDFSVFELPTYLRFAETLEGYLPLFASRGCTYSCRFCRMHLWPYQHKDPRIVLEEIRHLEASHRRIGLKSVGFHDPTFGLRSDLFFEMMDLFIKDGLADRLTWFCQTRPEVVTRRWAKTAARAGCQLVELGLESSEKVRCYSLNKNFTNAEFRTATKNLREAGIHFDINVLLGAPQTTLGDDLRALFFAESCRPASINANLFRNYADLPFGKDVSSGGEEFWQHILRRFKVTILKATSRYGLAPHFFFAGLRYHGFRYPKRVLRYVMNLNGQRHIPLNHPLTASLVTRRIINNLQREKLLVGRSRHRYRRTENILKSDPCVLGQHLTTYRR